MSYVPYQIDYKVQGTGKTLGVTKKKVLWKFGFANAEALSNGFSGSHCRGSEHEVIFLWSLKSGKRQIAVDGKECHYSESGMNGWTSDRTFQHHFNLVSPGYGTIRCHLITLPPNHDMPGGNKPFQLRVNGVSYFEFSSIFQLGTPAMIVRPQPAGASSSSARSNGEADPYMSPDERQAIARAKLESLRDIRKANSKDSADGYNNAAPRSAPQEQSLISFDDPPAPPQGVSAGPHMMSSMSMNSASFADSGGSFHTIPPPAPAAQYSNYALPQNAAPQYAQQPAAQQYQQPAAPPQYGQQPAAPAYQQPAAAPPQYAGAITPYGQAPAAAAPYSNYGFAQAPAAAPQQSYGFAPPPAAAWASPPPAYHGGQQPLAVNTAVAPGTPGGAYGTTPQSQVSYGSAPAFAQPPRQQSGQFGGY